MNSCAPCLLLRISPPAMPYTWYLFLFIFIFFPSHLLSSPFYCPSLLVATQIRGHIAGSSPPLPTTVRALHFFREKISALSSLVDSRRIVLTHARLSQQLILFFSFFLQNKLKISPRRDSNSRTNTSSIRGLPLVHRGDRLCLYFFPRSQCRTILFFVVVHS